MRGDDQQLQTGMFSYVVLEEPGKVAEALKKLQEHREPEAKFMRTTAVAKVPAYNVQAAVAMLADQFIYRVCHSH
jgi:hypothetical protein